MKNLYLLRNFGFRYILQLMFIYFGIVYSHLNAHSVALFIVLIIISVLRYVHLLRRINRNTQDFIQRKHLYNHSKINIKKFESTFKIIQSNSDLVYIKKKNLISMIFSFKEDFSIINSTNGDDYNITTRPYSYL